MKALIDADIFQYEFGSSVDENGRPLPWPFVQSRVQSRIDGIMEATKADSYQLYVTSDDKSNFRYKIATIKPYKGNRKDLEKPHYYQHIRNFLIDHRGAIEVHGMEADDAISIEQYKQAYGALSQKYKWDDLKGFKKIGTIICSRDKDLDMVPGWHYSWGAGKQKEKQLWWQDELNGIRSFYRQTLLGDTIDNIPGLFGVGKSSKLVTRVLSCVSELECYEYVLFEYTKRFGSYAEQFLKENARLLWMLQYEGQVWEPPTKTKKQNSTSEKKQ